eukprot:TRINITY_DN314_c0_g1_i4.p1 TRINITY_DN314_c0_g1~~TRINITY_DN314_c0_g1_i4.p1  ORF type:complete len:158 (-),score=38.02 TRINITY_DN314_c0_g1_i4:150-623(-)
MEPAPSYDNQALFEELLQLEFEPHLIRRALQLTNDKEKAVELIIQFLEGGAEAKEDHKTYEDYKMVFLVRGDLKMGTGKVAAQVGHAVLGAYKNAVNNPKKNETLFKWEYQGEAKIVLRVNNEEELLELEKKAKAKGLNTYVVCDAGRTQVLTHLEI